VPTFVTPFVGGGGGGGGGGVLVATVITSDAELSAGFA
jgi:hypothetical protein